MKITTLVLATTAAVFAIGAPSCCPTGMWFDGDECVCKVEHELDEDGKGCHKLEPLPIVSPSPSPSAEPTPESTPVPSPTPSPDPTPWPSCASRPDCGGPEGPDGVWGCCSEWEAPKYHRDVEEAVKSVMGMDGIIDSRGRVADESTFRLLVMEELKKKGYCVSASGGDGTDEIGVKLTNSYSEQFDILVGPQHENDIPINRRPAFYHTVSCNPARF